MKKYILKWQWLWAILFMYTSGYLLYLKGETLGFQGWDFIYEIAAPVGIFAIGYAFLVLYMQRNKLLGFKNLEDE